jgi:hypothetical protein
MKIQRRANWTPVIVSSCDARPEGGGTEIGQGDGVVAELTPHYDFGSENDLDRKRRQADLRFSTGVALALALPAFLGFGVYVAAESIRLIAS